MGRRATWALLLVTVLGACEGSGSDIGPFLEPKLPASDYRVLVHDDLCRGVSAASVSVSGISGSFPTGRSGRAAVLSVPSGMRLIRVDGSAASASDSDLLGTLAMTAATPDASELPYVVHLPDLSQSAMLTLNTGVQASASTLDDSGTSGVILTVPAGSNVMLDGDPTVTLATGVLQIGHLPGDLPVPPSGATLTGRGGYVGPVGVTFAPGADLSLPNDLQLPGGATPDLLHLDPTTGIWTTVGTGAVSGGTLVASGLVSRGGLYAFATTIVQTGAVTGRVIDAQGFPVAGVLVRGGEGRSRTASDGTFLIADLAAQLGDGSPRNLTAEFTGGRDLWPGSVFNPMVPAAGGTVDLGDVVLDTFRVGNVRMLLIANGRPDAERRMGISSTTGPTSSLGIGDTRAQSSFENQRVGSFGWLTSRPSSDAAVVSQGFIQLAAGNLTTDARVFGAGVDWWSSPDNGTSVFVVDRLGTGPVRDASVMRGFPPFVQFVALTGDAGVLTLGIGAPDQVTASVSSSAGGSSVISVWTAVDPESARVEIPVERADILPVGSFDRHGLVSGNLLGGASTTRMVKSTRRLERNDWYDSVFEGRDVLGDLPVKVDPAVTGGTAYTVGVAEPRGNLTAVEGSVAGPDFTLERMAVISGMSVPQGSHQQMDLSLSALANTSFPAPHALNNLDGSIALADLEFDLALVQADSAIDIVRGVDGNMAFNGLDVTFTLPPLSSFAPGSQYLLRFGGSSSAGGTTIDQRTVITLDDTPGPVVQFMDVPDILSPAPGATVPASGFTVDFTLPVSTLYIVVELRSELPGDTRVWTAVLPASFSSFEFFTPPAPAPNPLEPGRTWTLTVTAARVENGPLFGFANSYKRMLSHFVGISAAEREVNAFSSSQITIVTN